MKVTRRKRCPRGTICPWSGLGKKKSSQWERVDVEDPLKRTDSIFDKTFIRCIP